MCQAFHLQNDETEKWMQNDNESHLIVFSSSHSNSSLSFSLFVDFVFLKLQIKAFFPALEHTLTNNLTQLFFLLLTPH
jgi:hypothetical protein